MPQKPTVFISYRRQPSDDLARFLYDRLQLAGADVFFDREAINGGRFAAILEREIISRDYFLVILAPDTLESEWVRREIATALRHSDKVSLIPVTVGFSLGSAPLPEEIAELVEYDAIQYEREYADASVERVVKAIGLTGNPASPAPSGSGTHIEQHIGTMSGGTAIGSQVNVGNSPTSTPQSPAQEPAPKTPWLASGKWQGIGAIAGILAVVIAFIALPQIQQMFNTPSPTNTLAAVIAPSNTPTDIPVIPTDTDTPPSITAAPSETLIPTTPASPSDTPVPQTPPTTLPSGEANLRLFMTRESFTLVVDEAVNLSGLQFRVVGRTETLTDLFDILQLTGGMAQTGDCYVLVKNGAAPPLAGACAVEARTFKRNVAPADVFWYDSVGETLLSVAIDQNGAATGQVCPASEQECGIRYGS